MTAGAQYTVANSNSSGIIIFSYLHAIWSLREKNHSSMLSNRCNSIPRITPTIGMERVLFGSLLKAEKRINQSYSRVGQELYAGYLWASLQLCWWGVRPAVNSGVNVESRRVVWGREFAFRRLGRNDCNRFCRIQSSAQNLTLSKCCYH